MGRALMALNYPHQQVSKRPAICSDKGEGRSKIRVKSARDRSSQSPVAVADAPREAAQWRARSRPVPFDSAKD